MHPWYYYFNKQPEVKREELEVLPETNHKASTSKIPSFSLEEGIGYDFLQWLCTPCGGGKTVKEAKQIGKRAMKFFMLSIGANESDLPLTNEFVDCCLGSPPIIIKFLSTLEQEWKLSSSASLNYVKAIHDMVDFRKSNGVSDINLRCFTVTEVYLRRGRENLSKRKKVECSRNLDFESLIARDSWARTNGGFIDQREFKTAETYVFDTLIITEEVMHVLDMYIDWVRPLFNPQCDYLLVSNTGNQYQSLTTAMTMLVYQAIKKHINPTRYRQIVETESSDKLTLEEQEIISEDQKHSSTVAKLHYKKKQSRAVAIRGKECMEKMIGDKRKESTANIMNVLADIQSMDQQFDSALLENTKRIVGKEYNSCTFTRPTFQINQMDNAWPNAISADFEITKTVPPPLSEISYIHSTPTTSEISKDAFVEKEIAMSKVASNSRLKQSNKFTREEDEFLRMGIEKYGKKSWSQILNDKSFTFNESRTRDSLRMRACSSAFKNLKM